MKRKKNPFLVFLCCVLAVPTCGTLLGEFVLPEAITAESLMILKPWFSVGILLGIAHLLLRPLLRLLSAPIGCITFGLFGFIIDLALIYLCAYFVDGFTVSGPVYAVCTAILINAVCAITKSR